MPSPSKSHAKRIESPGSRSREPSLENWTFNGAMPLLGVALIVACGALADIVDRRRRWGNPLEASLFGNSVSRATFDAMQSAVAASLPDFRRWMRCKAGLHGYTDGLRWWDLVAPQPHVASTTSWEDGIAYVRSAFGTYSDELAGLVDRALEQQ